MRKRKVVGEDRRILLDPADIEVGTERIAGLPIVNSVLDRLGFDNLVAASLPEPDPRCQIEPARPIGLLVRNLTLGRRPLYGLGEWAGSFDPELLGLNAAGPETLSDDCVGRALDQLFLADRASLLTALSLHAITTYDIALDELHDDSTSLTLYGAYGEARGEPRAGTPPAKPARGFSKDHRPDLKQLVWVLTISADGAVPITYRLLDGNTEDSTTHIETWERCRALAGTSNFMYVADSKLATHDNIAHIAGQHGRFLTILPRTRSEDKAGRAWLAKGPVPWAEISRTPGKRKADPPEVYWAVPAPSCSAEGYRIVWMRSSSKRIHDAATRFEQIGRASTDLEALAESLSSSRCHLKERVAVEDAAKAAIAGAGATRWVRFEVKDEVHYVHRQERRGRPSPNTRYRRLERHSFSLSWSTDAEAVTYDAASDGCFPMVTCDTEMSDAELLAVYKRQPRLERRHATLKGVLEACPIELKSAYRIDAFGFCLYVALLIHALIERQLRHAMADAGISELPVYHEHRPCKAPTAARVLELLDPLARTIVSHRGHVLTVAAPTLSPLQEQILTLLRVDLSAYGPIASRPVNST
jgi:transposase